MTQISEHEEWLRRIIDDMSETLSRMESGNLKILIHSSENEWGDVTLIRKPDLREQIFHLERLLAAMNDRKQVVISKAKIIPARL